MKFLTTVALVGLAWTTSALKFSSIQHEESDPSPIVVTEIRTTKNVTGPATTISRTQERDELDGDEGEDEQEDVENEDEQNDGEDGQDGQDGEDGQDDEDENEDRPTPRLLNSTVTDPNVRVQPVPLPPVNTNVPSVEVNGTVVGPTLPIPPPPVPVNGTVVAPTLPIPTSVNGTVPSVPAVKNGAETWSEKDQKQFSEWQSKLAPITDPKLQADLDAVISNELKTRKNKK